MTSSSYKNLLVWQKSVDYCTDIYLKTESFPSKEQYGLTNQIRRAAVSIPSNIAEGQYRGHINEYIQFLRIAYASGAELETQLLIAHNIQYIDQETYKELVRKINEIMRMLNAMIKKHSLKSNH